MDLPTPLGPTTPMRLSGPTVTVTPSMTVRPPRSKVTWRATNVACGDGVLRGGAERCAGNGGPLGPEDGRTRDHRFSAHVPEASATRASVAEARPPAGSGMSPPTGGDTTALPSAPTSAGQGLSLPTTHMAKNCEPPP